MTHNKRFIMMRRVIQWFSSQLSIWSYSFQIIKMKEGLRKIVGGSFYCDIGEVHLVQTFREEHCEFDQLYFLTQLDYLICKVYDLEAESSLERFRREQEVYQQRQYQQLAEPMLVQEVYIKKVKFGVVLLKIPKKRLLMDIFTSLTYSDWLNLAETVLDFLEKLRKNGQAFLNINPWSIACDANNEFKFLDVQFLTQEGKFEDVAVSNSALMDFCENQYHYHSPELLDQYCKGRIDSSSDLFSFGIVLYELLYHQYPFDSKLSQISSNFKPLHAEKSFFLEFIELTLKPYSKRTNISQLKSMLEKERKKVPKGPTKNISSSTTQSKGSTIFSGITQILSKLTTETQGWYLNFTENDSNRPQEKYLNFIVNKLYKKQTKLDKLVSIIIKYVENADVVAKENQIIKTLLLIISLFRRGPSTIMNFQWDDLLRIIEAASAKSVILSELCSFCRQKISTHNLIKSIFRGNFYIDELSKFKLLTIQTLNSLYNHLSWMVDSINAKFIFLKDEKPILDYIREVYCDQILDSISMLIFSTICIRKDNQLQLRKDNLNDMNNIEKKLTNLLKKISNLSNHVSAHAIYSLEGEFFYYKQEFQLREAPYQTSLQHFYKYVREYKGLCIPQNYMLAYNLGDQKDLQLFEKSKSKSKRQKPEEQKQKKYFQEIDSDGQRNDSFKIIDSPIPENTKEVQKTFISQKIKQNKFQKESPSMFQIKNVPVAQNDKNKKSEQKKTVTFDQFFNFEPTSNSTSASTNKQFEVNFDQIGITDKKIKKKSDDFTFFEAFTQPKKQQKKQPTPNVKTPNNYLQLFGLGQKSQQNKGDKVVKAKKPQILGGVNSQQTIQYNILEYDWLQKAPLTPPAPPRPKKFQVAPELLRSILSGLKLKELKQAITNNQQIIIEFNKLKLQKVIGSGSAGEVYFGIYQKQNVAIKKVKAKENPNALKQFERQLLTYIKIKRNPHLVSLVGLSKFQQDYYLLTEFCNSGSLFDLLHKRANTTPLSWKQKHQIAIQVAKGMLALHQMIPPIIHRDLKSLNVFVIQNNNKFIAKVADFGLSRSPEAEMMTMYLGTLHWMAPELLDNKQYSIKVDVYSYAIVLWQICTRKTPYNELSNPMAIVKHVTIEKKRPNMSSIPPDCPPQMIQLMTSCWAEDPNQRPSFVEIIDQLSKTQIFC